MTYEMMIDTIRQKAFRIAAIGYGNRVRKYAKYIEQNSDKAKLTVVVEPNQERRLEAMKKFSIPEGLCFSTIDDFFSADSLPVDGVIIGTPDHLHYEPCVRAIIKGFPVLLEKPIAQTMEECNDILNLSKKYDVPVMLCYVLRYHPYYRKIKEIIDSRELGEIVSVNHIANVGIDRTVHSYVRGFWNNTSHSNPIILSKCCHDIDIINWLIQSPIKCVSSFGSLKWFTLKNAPQGSGMRCVDCKIERDCPFSAIDLYVRRKEWINNFIVPSGDSLQEVIEKEMKSGRYGRCVYHCDNDVVDHQVVSMVSANNIVINLSMDCFTLNDNRVTDIKCVFGEIVANDNKITVVNFKTKEVVSYDFSTINNMPLHANADLKIMEEFVTLLDRNKVCSASSLLDLTIDSHKICFAAEHSRLTGQIVHF